jgi:hypothetical protein
MTFSTPPFVRASRLLVVLLGGCGIPAVSAQSGEGTVVWRVDDTKAVAGRVPQVLGAPRAVVEDGRKALRFNGSSDGLILAENPIQAQGAFTIEVLFKPDGDGPAAQRFVHLEDVAENRALIETRVTPTRQWYLDTFLFSRPTEKGVTLVDPQKLHPCDRWYWAALAYDGAVMAHFVNGVKEQEAAIAFGPMKEGRTSLGVRLNQVFWFKGCIAEVRFHPRALGASALQRPSAPAGDAAVPASLPPRTVEIGRGGVDGFVAVDSRGAIHAIYGGKYRTGPTAETLGPEETIADLSPINGVRIATDAAGQPHVVFTNGATDNAKRSYYTTRRDGRWITPEKFADAADFPERDRAYVADVAVSENGHALVSFWVSRPREKRAALEDWSFYYRWRPPGGGWSEPRSLPAHWSSAPKVEYAPGRGFFLLWQQRSTDWRIAGPVTAGGTFSAESSTASGSATLPPGVQNEGADFSVSPAGVVVIAGNKREKFEGPVGVWATTGAREQLPPPVYLGSFPGTVRGSESGLHPVTAFDADTGHAFVSVLDAGSKRAVFTVHRPGRGWVSRYTPILPAHRTPQGTLRQGPSVADLPGPGVIALVRDGDQRWLLRRLLPEDALK